VSQKTLTPVRAALERNGIVERRIIERCAARGGVRGDAARRSLDKPFAALNA